MAAEYPDPFNNVSDSVKAFLDSASDETGLDDFGSSDFIEPLSILVHGVEEERPFHDVGMAIFKADIHRCLVNRLRFEEDLKRHPEILEEKVDDPIVIMGLVRTGTTKLQRMMSADPQVQKLHYWKILNPAPFSNVTPGEIDPRIEAAREGIALMRKISPAFMSAHPLSEDEAEEDLLMMPLTFETLVLYMLNPIRRYYDFLKNRPLHHTYEYLVRLMKYLQWQDGGRKGRRWIMKSPVHLGNIDALINAFPKAMLIHCHRDVAEVMPSFCNLTEAGLLLKSGEVDKYSIGSSMLELWQTEMNKYLKLRQGLAPDLDILDVSYRQINSNPIDVIGGIYRKAGLELTDASLAAMHDWEQKNPKDLHGKNTYSLEEYGLSKEKVNNAFEDYITQYGDLF